MLRKTVSSIAAFAILGFSTAVFAMPEDPPAPPKQETSTEVTREGAGKFIDKSESQGGHARSEHVGRTGKQLRGRNIKTATTFQKKTDQDRAGQEMMNSTQGKKVRNEVRGKHNNFKKEVVTRHTGRTRPIGKVVERKQDGSTEEHNIRVDETTSVLKKGPKGVRVQTMYPSKYTKLEKPKSGPNLKPTTKHNVTDVETGKEGLRKVPQPKERGLDLGGQKKFGNVTKGAKKKTTDEGSKTSEEGSTKSEDSTPKTEKSTEGEKKQPSKSAKRRQRQRQRRKGGNTQN